MKNSKKKLFVLIMVIVSTITLSTLQANAVSFTDIDKITYTYEGISAEKAEQIVKTLYGIPDNTVQPLNLLCIFGHSTQSGIIYTTEHNAYSTAPRCREITSYVDYCTRSGCSYSTVTSESSYRISCH